MKLMTRKLRRCARSDISDLEKRSRLRALLIPRHTPANTQHHLNRFRGIFKAAAKRLGYTGECRFMNDAELNRLIDRAKPRDDIAFHNTCRRPASAGQR